MHRFQSWYDSHEQELLEKFKEFLKFKSISSDPKFKNDVASCADFVSTWAQECGLETQVIKTKEHPVVLATNLKAGSSRPTVMLYQHYDVQPPEPYELWETDPFTADIRDNKVFARGAQDNKGQCTYTLFAVKAFLEFATSLNVNIKVCIEGGEESGSEGLNEALKSHKDLFKADYLLMVDSMIPKENIPGITLGFRGMVALELTCIGADTDMHSGSHGGIALNPIRALTDAIAKLWDSDGKIMVPGIYDSVVDMSPQEREKINFSFNDEEYKQAFGVKTIKPEGDYSPLESNWIRPSLEINGIWGGYINDGFKTVIPAKDEWVDDLLEIGQTATVPNWVERAGPEGKAAFNQYLAPVVGFSIP